MSIEFNNAKQKIRLDVIGSLLAFYSGEELPEPAELIALGEWIVDGSLTAAELLETNKAKLYGPDRTT